jgi:hypothetical protein
MSRKSVGCALAVVLAILVAITAFVYSPYYQFYQHLFVTEYTTFEIPQADVQIEHSRIGTHMLAEYDRWLTVTANGNRFATAELAIDTCGGYPINCYLIEFDGNSLLRLDDAVSEHLVDLGDGSVIVSQFGSEDLGVPDDAGTYIGQLDGKVGKLKFTPAVELPETKIQHLWDR